MTKHNAAYAEGYRDYNSGSSEKKFDNVEYQTPGYYYQCGWDKAKAEQLEEQLEEQRIAEAPKCPMCGSEVILDTYMNYCEECRYHEHNSTCVGGWHI